MNETKNNKSNIIIKKENCKYNTTDKRFTLKEEIDKGIYELDSFNLSLNIDDIPDTIKLNEINHISVSFYCCDVQTNHTSLYYPSQRNTLFFHKTSKTEFVFDALHEIPTYLAFLGGEVHFYINGLKLSKSHFDTPDGIGLLPNMYEFSINISKEKKIDKFKMENPYIYINDCNTNPHFVKTIFGSKLGFKDYTQRYLYKSLKGKYKIINFVCYPKDYYESKNIQENKELSVYFNGGVEKVYNGKSTPPQCKELYLRSSSNKYEYNFTTDLNEERYIFFDGSDISFKLSSRDNDIKIKFPIEHETCCKTSKFTFSLILQKCEV